MLAKIKNIVKKILPKQQLRKLRPFYHGPRAWIAAAINGFPGKKMKLIGITGTKGKTTSTVFLGRLLNLSGVKTGYISSAVINDGDFDLNKFNSGYTSTGEVLNDYKMSTIDPFVMQKLLKKMLENNCEFAVLEFTSQGLEAGRHWGLDGFNATLLLNIFPEHLDAHGGIENYIKAKSLLAKNTRLNGVFISDIDTSHLSISLKCFEDRVDIKRVLIDFRDIVRSTKDLKELKFNELEKFKISQSIEGYQILNYQDKKAETNFLAKFDAQNLGFGWVTMLQLGLKPDLLKLSQIWGVSGRMEWVVRNGQVIYKMQNAKLKMQNLPLEPSLSIMVDYAHETESLRQLLETLEKLKKAGDFDKVIHIFSVTGSGRDTWKRPQMARVTASISDMIVYTSEDHDEHDNLQEIEQEVLEYLRQNRAKKVISELNRLGAFKKAIEAAKTEFGGQKVLIVSTAMGSQQGMETANGVVEWDEREKWLEALSCYTPSTQNIRQLDLTDNLV